MIRRGEGQSSLEVRRARERSRGERDMTSERER